MEILYLLEKIRVPVLNEFMLLVTRFGEETAFLAVALIVFWCIDKRKAYFILSVGFMGTLLNQFLKLWFRIPRPWVLDEKFTILEQAREAATGYSFPSGHTQSAVGTFGGIAVTTENKWLRFAAVLIAVAVPLSRMYVGVHTPLDVTVAAVTALVLILVLRPVILKDRNNSIGVVLCIMSVMAIAFLCFVEFYNFPVDIDPHNLDSGYKNAYTLLGSLTGFIIVYIVDRKWLNFSVKAVWWAQILKVACGLAVVLAVKSGLKTPLNFLFGESLGRAVRYFLVVVCAGTVWPLSFRWFSNLKLR